MDSYQGSGAGYGTFGQVGCLNFKRSQLKPFRTGRVSLRTLIVAVGILASLFLILQSCVIKSGSSSPSNGPNPSVLHSFRPSLLEEIDASLRRERRDTSSSSNGSKKNTDSHHPAHVSDKHFPPSKHSETLTEPSPFSSPPQMKPPPNVPPSWVPGVIPWPMISRDWSWFPWPGRGVAGVGNIVGNFGMSDLAVRDGGNSTVASQERAPTKTEDAKANQSLREEEKTLKHWLRFILLQPLWVLVALTTGIVVGATIPLILCVRCVCLCTRGPIHSNSPDIRFSRMWNWLDHGDGERGCSVFQTGRRCFEIPKAIQRGEAWAALIGNRLVVTPELYRICDQLAKDALANGHPGNRNLNPGPPGIRNPGTHKEDMDTSNESLGDSNSLRNHAIYNSEDDAKNSPSGQNNLPDPESWWKHGRRYERGMILGSTGTVYDIRQDIPRTYVGRPGFTLELDESKKETLNINQQKISASPSYRGIHLQHVLQAYCFYRPDVGYVQGMSYIAGHLLLYMDEYTAFVAFANLLSKPFFNAFYMSGSVVKEAMESRLAVFDHMFRRNLPKLHTHLKKMEVPIRLYFFQWSLTLYAKIFNFETLAYVWHGFFIEGEVHIYKVGVAVLKIIEKDIYDKPLAEVFDALTNPGQGEISAAVLRKTLSGIRVTTTVMAELERIQATRNVDTENVEPETSA